MKGRLKRKHKDCLLFSKYYLIEVEGITERDFKTLVESIVCFKSYFKVDEKEVNKLR